MKRLILLLAVLLSVPVVPVGAQAQNAIVVSACGAPPVGVTYATGQTRPVLMDTTGTLCTVGGSGGGGGSTPTGPAGTPNANVVSVQGITGGTPLPITGTISATNPSVSATGAAAPASATYVGVLSGGNLVGWNGAITNTTFASTQSGAWTTGRTWTLGSGTDTVALGAGAATIGAISNTAFGATQSGAWNITNITGTVSLPTGASTSALQTTGNTSLASLAGTVGTLGSASPTTAQQVSGKTPAGNGAALLTDTAGRLLPGQGLATSTQATTVASTSTTLIAANTGRLLWEVQIETALTAPLYLCFSGQTCSATVHDRMLASGTGAGVLYTSAFGFQGAVTYYTTQASVILNQTAWTVQ